MCEDIHFTFLIFSYFQHSYWPDAILHWKHGATNESVNMHAFIGTLQGTITYLTWGSWESHRVKW